MLKPFTTNTLLRLSALFAFFILVFLTLNCGKRRPPQPPTERILQRTEIFGFQRGNRIFLEWTLPPRNASAGSILSIRQADVYRLAEPADSPLPLTEEEFAARSTLIGSVAISAASNNPRRTVNYTDKPEIAGQQVRLRYAIRFINANGQAAEFSNFLLIAPASRVANAPLAENPAVTETAIIVRWQSPATNTDNSAPVNIIGYNVYRRLNDSLPLLLNQTPLTDNTLTDENFKFGEKYTYFVRAVSLGAEALPVESSDSNEQATTPQDTFAPKPPEGLTIAAAPLRLALFFVPNLEKDLAGYAVFRSTDPALPKTRWTKLSKELLTATTFEDKNIESGQKYYYFVTAVDQTGNMSAPSEVVAEVAP